ncbi:MAG: acyltransferase [Clostridia bacterium]|nr:acyltransferase [Clostridia bacterium]
MLKIPCHLPKLMMKFNGVKYGKNLKLLGYPFVFKFKNCQVEIGNNCIINSNFFSNFIGLFQRTIIIARYGGKIRIGNKVGISGATIYAWKEIEIGDNTLIGANTKIMDNDFHPIDPNERKKSNGPHNVKQKPVKIGNNVFIGCNCLILKGTVIGDNCVVGAGSVVSGTFEDGCIIAGNPARVIKKCIDKEGN